MPICNRPLTILQFNKSFLMSPIASFLLLCEIIAKILNDTVQNYKPKPFLKIRNFPNHKKIILNSAKYPDKISDYLLGKTLSLKYRLWYLFFIIQGISTILYKV
jgi:hypothetical protein